MSIKSLLRGRTLYSSSEQKARILATTPVDATATSAGATTGTIATGTQYVNVIGVTSQPTYMVLLPAIPIGETIYLRNISNLTCEVRTSDASTIFINGGLATGKEVVMATDKFFTVTGITATMVHLESVDYPIAD